MLHFKLAIFATLWVGSSARELRASASRNLLEAIAGYMPTTVVTDQNAIDQDQKVMEGMLGLATDAGFTQALGVYKNGGNSGSYAKLTLGAALAAVPKVGDTVSGVSATGSVVTGKVLDTYTAGSTTINVAYDPSEAQLTHSTCRVGSLDFTLVSGCFAPSGNIKINNGANIAYSYTVATDNDNSITLGLLSTGSATLQTNSAGKYYPYYQKYVDYFGDTSYSDKIIMAAFDAKSITLKSTLVDFVGYPIRARDQVIRKTSAYTTLLMTVVGYMERAIENCVANKEALSSLDLAVAYYTGSQEGTDGAGVGFTLMNHGDRRCGSFKTCGVNRDQINGTSKVNFVMADVFKNMKDSLTAKNCVAAKTAAATGMSTLLIPQIQGTLRYARLLAARTNYTGHEISESEGAAFAIGVLPMVASCDAAAATTIWSNLRFKIAKAPDAVAVKAAFDKTLKCLGISCADLGGQWDTTSYFPGFGPCVDAVPTAPTPTAPTPAATPVGAPAAAAPTPVAAPPAEDVGFIRGILRGILNFFKNIFG